MKIVCEGFPLWRHLPSNYTYMTTYWTNYWWHIGYVLHTLYYIDIKISGQDCHFVVEPSSSHILGYPLHCYAVCSPRSRAVLCRPKFGAVLYRPQVSLHLPRHSPSQCILHTAPLCSCSSIVWEPTSHCTCRSGLPSFPHFSDFSEIRDTDSWNCDVCAVLVIRCPCTFSASLIYT